METRGGHVRTQTIKDSGGVCAELGQRLAQVGKRAQLFRKLDGPLRQAGKIVVNAIDQSVAKAASCFGIKVEGHWCIRLFLGSNGLILVALAKEMDTGRFVRRSGED